MSMHFSPTPSFISFYSSFSPKREHSHTKDPLPKGGAHQYVRAPILSAMANTNFLSCYLILLIILQHAISSLSVSESEILLRFRESLENNGALSGWDSSKPPCNGDKENWEGLMCENGAIWGLKLENMGLKGKIDCDSLSELKSLRTASFMQNNFEGSFPEINKVTALKTIYFSNNKFSGEIPSRAFDGMHSVKKIHIANNKLSGVIPSSLTALPKLIELMLEDNEFVGEIPEFRQERLTMLNVSNNRLDGPIPASLSKLNESSFSGNQDLCGQPLEACSSSHRPSIATIVIVVIASVVALAAIIVVIVILRRRKQIPDQDETILTPSEENNPKKLVASSADVEKGLSSSPNRSPDHQGKMSDQSIKLSFLRDDRERFDMSDLLRASAEILGGGVFGSSYKAAINSGNVMVVKRYRQMNNVNKEEFHEHMRRLGRLSHQNLLPLVAFYYRKEEKLLVSDYIDNVSLAVHLHGNKSRGEPCPDWPTRLKIVKGVSKGLLYLYKSLPSLIAPHGHLKSSNVLLSESLEPVLTDYGLVPVVNLEHAQEQMIAYKSPEYKQNNRITKKTDVWSLGIMIIEILTGKFPSNFLQPGKGSDTDIATWVHSVLKDDLTMEVFDKDMRGRRHGEGEMMKLLKIGLHCCEAEVDKRLNIAEAVERVEEIRERDGDDDFYSSYTSETDMGSSRGLSSDFDHVHNG